MKPQMDWSHMQVHFTGLILAQADNAGGAAPVLPGNGGEAAAPGSAGRTTSPWGSSIIIIPLLLIMVFMIWTSSSAQRKERKKREAMLAALKRHDRVQTIGGLIGSIVEIKDNEVILKVDEANNVKMRFAKSAVQQVLAEGPGDEPAIRP